MLLVWMFSRLIILLYKVTCVYGFKDDHFAFSRGQPSFLFQAFLSFLYFWGQGWSLRLFSLVYSVLSSLFRSCLGWWLMSWDFYRFLEISPPSDSGLVKIFSHPADYHFILLTVSFSVELFSLMKSSLLIVPFSVFAVGILFRMLSSVSMGSKLFPIFSSLQFSVSGFISRSLIHLDLTHFDSEILSETCQNG